MVLMAAAAFALTPPSEEIAPGVHFIGGVFAPGQQPDGNSVIFAAPAGWIIVDTGRHRAHTETLLDFVERSGKPLAVVINTHWHLDHVGGNVLIRKRAPQARIMASGAIEDALSGFLADSRERLESLIRSADTPAEDRARYRIDFDLIEAGEQLAPDEVIARSGTRSIAGRELELHLETHAVTAGDVWLLDPRTRVLVAGDLVTLPVPFLDTACPQRWAAALERLSDADFEWLVPGHGAPMNRERFERYRKAYGNLLSCAGSERAGRSCADGWIDDAGELVSEVDPAWLGGMLDYYLDTSLRGDPAATAKLCGDAVH
jgi:glyoxylase-like metal-dependent hydrolase (beta-lactamase superfamily II)